jgi:ADP-ribose pyrophosphatase YjhB (NUDIX family)
VADRFCPACGGALTTRRLHAGEPERQVRARCGRVHYRNAKPTACALVLREGRVLLVRRAIAPRRGCWDIPSGPLEAGEHLEAGVVRELREETRLDIAVTGLLRISMDRYDTPDGPVGTLNVVYLAAAPADDAAATGWFTPDEVPAAFGAADPCCRCQSLKTARWWGKARSSGTSSGVNQPVAAASSAGAAAR